MITEEMAEAALPPDGFLRRYVLYGKTESDCNIASHIGCGLAILAQTAPLAFGCRFGSRVVPSNIFSLIVGPSTESRKSTAAGIACHFLQQSQVQSSIGNDPGSSEGLFESVARMRKQVITYSEFGHTLAKAESGYLESLKTRFNELYDGVPLSRALAKKNQEVRIENARVSILACVNSSYLEAYTNPEDWTGGFLARFLTLFSRSERSIAWPMPDLVEKEALVTELRQRFETTQTGEFIGLDPDAQRLWTEWHSEIEEAIKKSAENATAASSRAEHMALRVAQLLSLDYGEASAGQQPWRITAAELESSIKITRLHMHSVGEIAKTMASTPWQRERRQLLCAIAKICEAHPDQGLTLGDLITVLKIPKRRVMELIESIAEEGLITKQIAYGYEVWVTVPKEQLAAYVARRHSSTGGLNGQVAPWDGSVAVPPAWGGSTDS